MKRIVTILTLSIILTVALPAFASRADGHGAGAYPEKRQPNPSASNHDDVRRERSHRPQRRDHFSWRGQHFRQGQPVPRGFRAARYRVKDWRAHGLYQPRHGQHWVYINGNYVLIAAASGIITTILLDRAGGH
ncbi:RcnB family protein [Affinibrenneria salicis]|uniref:RcnB family protein n=1 Tax=Affinibrenneria salicis TaxID=2590031 RepID=A0A5J5G3W0_9GAMM|nr:RcnB family protein [Affinibrenneria salicis]KAA9001351.1 RcnB family protein [Affinibrenneria salicis]